MNGDIAALVTALDPAGPAHRPWRHQSSLLLWAVDRAALGMPRLVAWPAVREQLGDLLVVLGHPGSRGTPEYPFIALARTPWWELTGFTTSPPVAHSSAPRKWLDAEQPNGGLREDVYRRMRDDETERGSVYAALLTRFFADEDPFQVMAAVRRTTAGRAGRSVDLSWTADELRVVVGEHLAGSGSLDDVEAAAEGRTSTCWRTVRSRHQGLREAKKAAARQLHGCLACEVCGFDFEAVYGGRGADFVECHHVTPLHVSGRTTTVLEQLSLVCANCHRMLHRGGLLTPVELREVLLSGRTRG